MVMQETQDRSTTSCLNVIVKSAQRKVRQRNVRLLSEQVNTAGKYRNSNDASSSLTCMSVVVPEDSARTCVQGQEYGRPPAQVCLKRTTPTALFSNGNTGPVTVGAVILCGVGGTKPRTRFFRGDFERLPSRKCPELSVI